MGLSGFDAEESIDIRLAVAVEYEKTKATVTFTTCNHIYIYINQGGIPQYIRLKSHLCSTSLTEIGKYLTLYALKYSLNVTTRETL